MTMSTNTNSTDLVNTDDNTITIPTLDTGTSFANLSDFPVNKWGYKKDSGNFIPFTSPTTILESDTYANDDTTTLTFATKIDYLQESGTYNTTFQFNTVANPLVNYMQDFTAAMCQEKASDVNYTVVDKRDNQEYTVRYINGNCWMTRNLAIGCNGVGANYGDTRTSISLTSTNSDIINPAYTFTYTPSASNDLTSSGASTDFTNARVHCSNTQGAWYNYAYASAGHIVGSSNSNNAQISVCPAGWKMPDNTDISGPINNYANFNLVASPDAGFYRNGALNTRSQDWWTTIAYSTQNRYILYWNGTGAPTSRTDNSRSDGFYIRCIAK